MTRRARVREPIDDLPEVDVFVPGPDGEPMEFVPPPTPVETLRQLSSAVSDGLSALTHVSAAAGHRLGPIGDRPDRRGSREEIVTPLLVDPFRATTAAIRSDLFADPVRRLEVDETSLAVEARGLSWPAMVRTSWFRSRRATLRLYASPSANITVLELIPDRPRLIGTRAFLRVGVAAVTELGNRIERSAGGHTRTRGRHKPAT